jgi:hypothetical protein
MHDDLRGGVWLSEKMAIDGGGELFQSDASKGFYTYEARTNTAPMLTQGFYCG